MGVASVGEAARELEAATIRFRYKNASLSKLVEDVARATGERFVFDPALAGRVTAIVPRKVTRSEALALLEATLLMHGYALMRGPESEWQVLRIAVASSGAPWGGPVLEADRPGLITTLIQLETVNAADIASRISHLVGRQDKVVAYPPTNSLILTGSERRVSRMIELAQALDARDPATLWVRNLRHRGVLEISEMLRTAMTRPEGAAKVGEREPLRIWSDERTNSLILHGPEEEIARARAFIDELELPQDSDAKIRVVRIYHRDADEIGRQLVAMALDRLLGGPRAARVGTSSGAAPYFIAVDRPTNSLVIDADPGTLVNILEMIGELDQPQPRIQLDVIAYEVSSPVETSLAFDWFLPIIEPSESGQTSFTVESNPSGGGRRAEIGPDISFFGRAMRDPLVLPFVDDSGNVVEAVLPREAVLPGEDVVITANDRRVTTRVLMKPRLTMVSGEEQEIFVGQNVPVPVSQPSQALVAQTNTQVERQDIGIHLRVNPKLGQAGKVELDLQLEISRLTPSVAGSIEVVGPTIESRSIQSKIFLSDGELAVIGMSQEGSRTGRETGTPFLKDIPVLGVFFRSSGISAVDSHILFAVQVRILRSHAEDLAESIRQRLALERSQSRVSGLERSPGEPYAILITTRRGRDDAEAIAKSFEREGSRAQIGRWMQRGEERFDVYLTGYDELSLAGADALRLRERGWGPQVVVLPGETALATTPPLRTLGSRVGVSSRSDLEAP